MTVRSLFSGLAALTALCPFALANDGRGADVAWTTYEAENAKTNGVIVGPDFAGHTPAREASGRKAVRFSSADSYIEFSAESDAQGIIVRYSLQDSDDGKGIDSFFSLYVNGKLRCTLAMTSRLSHLYGAYPFTNNLTDGLQRNFWDEVRALTGEIKKGDVVRIQNDAGDKPVNYLIDFVELEPVVPAIAQPTNSISVLQHGAKSDDEADDRAAFIAAIADAKSQKKSVWIPSGRFVIKGTIDVADVTIQGAGMWHTELVGADDYAPAHRVSINGVGSIVTLSDFSIFGKLNYRNDSEPNDAIGGSFGTGSTIRNLWIEHTKAGIWVVNSDGLLIEGCRFRNTIADGINLCVGMRNSIVRNCTARGTGDDCFAMWPATYVKSAYSHGGNRYERCTAQLPFLAQAFSIYGGEGNSVQDCLAIDIPYGAGLFASTTFASEFGFHGTTTYRNVTILRAGGTEGAIGTVANLIDLVGVHFENIDVIDSPADGIKFISINGRALRDASFDHVRVVNSGIGGTGHAIVEVGGSVGSATMSYVTVDGSKSNGVSDESQTFDLIRGEGNVGLEKNKSSRTQ